MYSILFLVNNKIIGDIQHARDKIKTKKIIHDLNFYLLQILLSQIQDGVRQNNLINCGGIVNFF